VHELQQPTGCGQVDLELQLLAVALVAQLGCAVLQQLRHQAVHDLLDNQFDTIIHVY